MQCVLTEVAARVNEEQTRRVCLIRECFSFAGFPSFLKILYVVVVFVNIATSCNASWTEGRNIALYYVLRFFMLSISIYRKKKDSGHYNSM